MRSTSLALAGVLIGLFPQAGRAGLIQYNWEVTDTVYPGNPSPGSLWVAPGSGTVISSDPNIYTVLSTASLSGWQQAVPPSQNEAYVTNFNVSVTLTDISSGQSGTINFHGSAGITWTQQPDGAFSISVGDISAAPSGASSLILGSNRYSVQTGFVPIFSCELANNYYQAQPITVPIAMSLSPLQTPEPSTLLLAVAWMPLAGFFPSKTKCSERMICQTNLFRLMPLVVLLLIAFHQNQQAVAAIPADVPDFEIG